MLDFHAGFRLKERIRLKAEKDKDEAYEIFVKWLGRMKDISPDMDKVLREIQDEILK